VVQPRKEKIMKRSEYQKHQALAAVVAQKVFPFIRAEQIEIAGFGLEKPSQYILGLVNLFNQSKAGDKTRGFCGKLLICLPATDNDTGPECPMHHHASTEGEVKSKNEGFFVVHGVLLIRNGSGDNYLLRAGQTAYLPAGARHALSAGTDEGCVFFEFSDLDQRVDVFDDPKITRDPEIEEDVKDYVPTDTGFPILGQEGLIMPADVTLTS